MCFNDRFYWPQPEVTEADLMNLRPKVDEPAAYFIERFRKMTVKSSLQFPESQYTSVAIT